MPKPFERAFFAVCDNILYSCMPTIKGLVGEVIVYRGPNDQFAPKRLF